jgi:hypothetical protein
MHVELSKGQAHLERRRTKVPNRCCSRSDHASAPPRAVPPPASTSTCPAHVPPLLPCMAAGSSTSEALLPASTCAAGAVPLWLGVGVVGLQEGRSASLSPLRKAQKGSAVGVSRTAY